MKNIEKLIKSLLNALQLLKVQRIKDLKQYLVFGLLLILWWRHRGYDGFDSISHEPSRLKRWLDEQKEKWRAKRPPRIRRDKDSKDYSDYHYHKPL